MLRLPADAARRGYIADADFVAFNSLAYSQRGADFTQRSCAYLAPQSTSAPCAASKCHAEH